MYIEHGYAHVTVYVSEKQRITYQDLFSSVSEDDLLELALLAPDVEVAVEVTVVGIPCRHEGLVIGAAGGANGAGGLEVGY
jgi:hypothetical protein